jgi:hypothetical protein
MTAPPSISLGCSPPGAAKRGAAASQSYPDSRNWRVGVPLGDLFAKRGASAGADARMRASRSVLAAPPESPFGGLARVAGRPGARIGPDQAAMPSCFFALFTPFTHFLLFGETLGASV